MAELQNNLNITYMFDIVSPYTVKMGKTAVDYLHNQQIQQQHYHSFGVLSLVSSSLTKTPTINYKL